MPHHTSKMRAGRSGKFSWARSCCCLVILALACPVMLGADSAGEEYAVKAAFLFHFAQFIEWPPDAFADAASALTYCTLGQDPFQGALDSSLSGKTIGSRPLRVRHLKSSQDAQACHVVFLGAVEKKSTAALLAAVQGKPVLTVGEAEHFAADGGIIGFCLVENKVRFEINLRAAEKARLKISSRLLSLAKAVVGSSEGS